MALDGSMYMMPSPTMRYSGHKLILLPNQPLLT